MNRTIALAALGLGVVIAVPAHADCSASSSTVSCTGIDSNGFKSDDSGLTLIVGATASVSHDKDAIQLNGASETITNHGSVSSTKKDAIQAKDGAGNHVTNTGTISGANAGGGDMGDGIKVGADGVVVNSGTITAGDDGVQGDDNLNFTNTATGTIDAVDKGVSASDANGVHVENYGLINSRGDEGVAANDGFYLLNKGTITANDDGVQINAGATIDNYGAIRSIGNLADPQDGIDIDDGSVTNHAGATIHSQYDAGIDFDASAVTTHIDNAGTISGNTGILVETGEHPDPSTGTYPAANTAAQIITNSGLIEGRANTQGNLTYVGYSLYLGAGNDQLTMKTGGTLIGAADFGADQVSLIFDGLFSGAVAAGALLDGGADDDTISFTRYAFADITALTRDGDVFRMALGSGSDAFSLRFTSWEQFSFSDQTVGLDRISAIATPVPLPATGLLLLAGFGGLGALRRRKG